jgi:hypothetical protein
MQTGFPNEKRRVLAALSRLPNTDDLETLLHLAQTSKGELFELPFRLGSGEFIRLQTVIGRRNAEFSPTWYLYRGAGPSAKLEWMHQLEDMKAIIDLIKESLKTQSNQPQTAEELLNDTGSRPKFQPFSRNETPTNQNYQANGDKPYATTTSAFEPPKDTRSIQAWNRTQNPSARVFEGDLTRLPIEALLQSVVSGKMTGRLICSRDNETATVYFSAGLPFDAQIAGRSGAPTGEEAVIELASWSQGHFAFHPEQLTCLRTVHRRLESLLMEAACFKDYLAFLEQASIFEDTLLKAAIPSLVALSQEQLDSLRSHGNFNQETVGKIYENLRHGTTIKQMSVRLSVSKVKWVPIIYALMASGLLLPQRREETQKPEARKSTFSETEAAPAVASFLFSPKQSKNSLPPTVPLPVQPTQGQNLQELLNADRLAAETFTRTHIYDELGVMSYLAFLYFVEQEYYRFECFQSPYSLVLIKTHFISKQGEKPLNKAALEELVKRLTRIKRKADNLAYYQREHLALLLPQTEVEGVRAFANRIVQEIMSQPLSQEQRENGETISLTIGLASLPEECEDWVSMISRMHTNQRRFLQ